MYGLIVFSLLVLGSNAKITYKNIVIQSSPEPLPFVQAVPVPAPVPVAVPAPLPVAVPAPVPAPAYAPPVPVPAPAYAAPVAQSYGPIEAAVQTRRTYEVRPVVVEQAYTQPQVIDISPNYDAVQVNFRTAGSKLNVQQSHYPSGEATVEHTASQDAPHRLIHDINKPVIQEVREVIQPYRRISQEIKPVVEEIHTVVHKGERPAYAAPATYPVPAPAPVAPAYGAAPAVVAKAGYKAAKGA